MFLVGFTMSSCIETMYFDIIHFPSLYFPLLLPGHPLPNSPTFTFILYIYKYICTCVCLIYISHTHI
jgi:hypothetical protein